MEYQTNADFRKATLGELKALMLDETNGMGVRHRAAKEMQRRGEQKPFGKMIKSEITAWAREKSVQSIENQVAFKKNRGLW